MKNGIYLICPILFAFFYLVNNTLLPSLSWHDSQRFGQIALIIYAIFFGIVFKLFEIKAEQFYFLLGFLILGAISSFRASLTIWSFTEMAMLLGCYGLGLFIYRIFCSNNNIEKLSFFILFLTTSSLILYFVIAYISSLYLRLDFDVWGFIKGFTNPRFFGQFCTLAIPILIAPVLMKSKWDKAFYILVCMVAFMAIASGTRGTFLGVGSVAALYLFLNSVCRKFSLMIVKIFLTAFFMQLFFIDFLPKYLNIFVENNALERKVIGLSARDFLWLQAVEMIADKPFFGFGPMHFANIQKAIASHPHQLFLQIFSEWGIIFGLLFIIAFVKVVNIIILEIKYSYINKSEESKIIYICLAASIFASLVQSMVDGVFVMPYTQILFVYMAAWISSMHCRNIEALNNKTLSWRGGILSLILICSVCILIYSFFPGSHTHIDATRDKYLSNFGFLKPRFWLNGEI